MTYEYESDLELKSELNRLVSSSAGSKTWEDVKERACRKEWTPQLCTRPRAESDHGPPEIGRTNVNEASPRRRRRGARYTAYAFLSAVLVAAVALGSVQLVRYLDEDRPVIVISDDTSGMSPASTGQASQPTGPSAPSAAIATPVSLPEPPERLLIVGNLGLAPDSGLEADLAGLADSLQPAQTMDVSFVWGWMSSSVVYGEEAIRAAIREGGHDVVLLQLQEDLVEDWGESTGSLLENAQLFDEEIKGAEAETVLFMSWPWKSDNVPTAVWTTLQVIAKAHRDLSSELEAPVAPVALAFAQALEQRPDLALVDQDWTLTEAATYLAACVVYATLFGESPVNDVYIPVNMSSDDALFLQEVAWETVMSWYGN